jgi:hypothetical protein
VAIGKIIKVMVRESLYILMVMYMREIGLMIRLVEKVSIHM